MASEGTCRACGGTIEAPSCPRCGVALLAPAEPLDEQTVADRDQTASDADQTAADRDQTASDSDQRSADADQEASDEDYASGGDPGTHARTTRARAESTLSRTEASAGRDEHARARLGCAEDRDRAAELRDRLAAERDAQARLEDRRDEEAAAPGDVLLRADQARARAASDRARAADDRARAAADREEAARERAEALRNRQESADLLRSATTDELTGAWTRRFGLDQAARELEHTRRTGATLVLAFLDVDGLKRINDSEGHPAGDALLALVGATLRANVRPYDVVIRYGGDEFVCAMPDLGAHEARARFERITAEVRAADARYSVTFGLAETETGEGEALQDLIARADADLLETRSARRG